MNKQKSACDTNQERRTTDGAKGCSNSAQLITNSLEVSEDGEREEQEV